MPNVHSGELSCLFAARPTREAVNPLPKWRLRRVREFVVKRIGERITLPELAAAAGLSRMHFAAQFRAATGYRPHEYLHLQRIEQAKEMLADSDAPLVEVALSVGFCTQSQFSTVFKRVTDQTPAQWRSAKRLETSDQRSLRRAGYEATRASDIKVRAPL